VNLDATADMIDKYGQPITLRRTSAHGIYFDVETMAMITVPKRLLLNELVDGITQLNQRVTISNRDIERRQWPGPPRRGDQIIADGVTTTILEDPDTTQIGEKIVRHDMWMRG